MSPDIIAVGGPQEASMSDVLENRESDLEGMRLTRLRTKDVPID